MGLTDALLLDPAPFSVWIAYRTDGVKGSGTASDPWDGSTPVEFDARMSELPSNTCIHLGPSPRDAFGVVLPFRTQGYADGVAGGWQIKPGMKITGSGIDVTVLQLANHTEDEHYFAIGHDISAGGKVDLAEVSDLTIDCDLTQAGLETAASAVRLMGDHVRIRRVKAINWGSKDAVKPCSALSCITAMPQLGLLDVSDAGIEDCVVVSPGAGNVAACTALSAGAPDGLSSSEDGHGRAPYIRDCFVDCGVTTPSPDPSSGKFRGVAMGWCQGGVVECNQIHNCDIGGPYQDGKRSAGEVIVRNNYYRNVGCGPYWNLGTFGAETGPGTLARSGAVGTVSGLSSFAGFEPVARVKVITTPADYSGVYLIQTRTSTAFTVTVVENGSPLVEATSVRKVFGVTRALVEGNVIELAQVSGAMAVAVKDNNDGGSYIESPDYVNGDVIIRHNKVRYVDGVAPNDGGAALIDLRGVKNALVQSNVFDTVATAPIQAARCGAQSYFDNRTQAGALLPVSGVTANDFDETLAFPAEDAFVMANFCKH